MNLSDKHILFIVENNSVPFDRRVWNESNSIAKIAKNVSIICPINKQLGDIEIKESMNNINIIRFSHFIEGKSTSQKFTTFYFIIEYILAFSKILWLSIKLYIINPFDIIHTANPPDIFFLIALLFRPFGVKFIFDHHDLSPEGYLAKKERYNKDYIYYILCFFEWLSFKVADTVISTNISYKDIALTRGNKNDNDVFIVRNSSSLQIIPKTKEISEIKKYSYLVGYFGLMSKLDGVENLIYAVDYIVNKTNIKYIGFIIIGHGPCSHELNCLARELDLEDYIHFTNFLDAKEAYSILKNVDLAVSPEPPNRFNNNSTMIKIMDYMVLGLPIIAFDLKESHRTAKNSAYYVLNYDPESFGKAIIKVIKNKRMRKKMGIIGKQQIKDLNWAQSEENLFKAYERI